MQEVCVVDVCTQTDITFEHIMALAKLRPATPPVPDICPFLLSDSCHSIHTMEQEYFECPEYLSNGQTEVERTEEFEYEEVELCRHNSQEKLGLTLCYRTDDEDTAIYVSQVGPNSIAARDGRIREGDRILQINGHDVQNKEEAVALLSSEECRSIVLLVTRPEIQMEEGWLDEEHSEFLEELKMEILEEQRKEESQQMASQEQEGLSTEPGTGSPSKPRDQSRGLDQGNQHTEASQTSAAPRRRSPQRRLRDRIGVSEPRLSTSLPRSGLSRDREPSPGSGLELGLGLGLGLGSEPVQRVERVERDHFQQLLELKCQIRNRGECGLYYSRCSSTMEYSVTEQPGGGVERELRMLNEELHSIELECQSIMQAHQLRQTQSESIDYSHSCATSPASSNGGQRVGKEARQPRGKLADIRELPERWNSDKLRDKDSSSAYNTAESARSTPLGTERSPDHSLQRRVNLTNLKNLHGSAHNSPAHMHARVHTHHAHTLPALSSHSTRPTQVPSTPGSPNRALPAPPATTTNSSSLDQSPSNPSESDPALPADDERCERKSSQRQRQRPQPVWHASPYHTTGGAPNTHTGATRNYQSYMQLLQQHSSSSLEYSQSQLSLLSLRPARPGEPRLEFKVKVRADGTRYVARRPTRDRILRERALRIREERSGGMTTDDDAASELKMGRYWSKEERKQQLARAREQRRRREFMQRSRLECLKETGGGASGAPEGRKEVNILELSQKKMMKKRNKKILDNWMTIQELMTHGARVPEGTKVHNAFLSVTTV
ncbi:PDZ domain-containing RING finger protein 4 [Clupea harengus]|uniref:PDZ domain-containing RING finger protein 4 n=1 Tax=Clupea harengus TaxID=7950 RepID=A0A8M1KU96_CLUHA|nr:PDZ domain-containing RING finger protein 4 [Clupea harengus]